VTTCFTRRSPRSSRGPSHNLLSVIWASGLSRVPVKIAGLRQFFLALWCHLGGVGFARLTARTKHAPRHLIFGFPFFFEDFFRHDGSERTMRAAKEPAEPKRDGHRGIGLGFDRVTECALQ
jgi:hypothetical protein